MIWIEEEKGVDESLMYREPEKPQIFRERWSAKTTQGLVQISDIRHAISNSDQYPYPLWHRDQEHAKAQDAQTETLNAVITAIDRVPIYEENVDPDAISRIELLAYLTDRLAEYREAYTVSDILRDIADFQINRKRKE